MLPPIYTRAVLADYHQKLAANDLSLNIKQLSPASFKDACLEMRKKRFSRKDELPLMAYFGAGSDQEACLLAIAALDIDKFRPLVYFIKGKTQKPDDKVVELVAWLIDFQDRPYDPRKTYSITPDAPETSQMEIAVEAHPTESSEIEDSPIPNSLGPNEDGPKPDSPGPEKHTPTLTLSGDRVKGKKRGKVILVVTISIAFGMVIYWTWLRKQTPPRIEGQRCMYWIDDHYQPVDCNQKVENIQVVALDTGMVYHFKKINQPDTITLKAIGSLWYARYRGSYEFYTADGFHPIDPNIRLRPVTEGIIRHHVPSTP